MEFLSIFGNVVAKNRAFGNNIIFLQQFFFNFGWGERSLCSPLPAPLDIFNDTYSIAELCNNVMCEISVWLNHPLFKES